MISRHKLVEIIAEQTLDIRDNSKLAREVAAYLITEHRSDDLNPIMRDVMQYRHDKGIVEATAVSAHDLTPEIIKDVHNVLDAEFPDAKEIIVTTKYDPSLVGGVRIDLANQQLDLTVRAKLNTFKRLTALVKE